MKKTKTQNLKDPIPYLFKVAKASSKRLHIEIPSKHVKNFEAGESVEIRKLSLTRRGEMRLNE